MSISMSATLARRAVVSLPDEQSLAEVFSANRQRLMQMVRFRFDQRLHGRVDPEDILQEAYLDAAKRIDHYEGNSSGSLFLWLRMVVNQTLIDVHRRHLGAQMRDATREVSIHAPAHWQATSASLAGQLSGHLTSPSQAAVRAETAWYLERVLEEMDSVDREVIAMRHFEELDNREVAEVLGIREAAASNRYVRAIKRLREILSRVPDFSQANGGGKGREVKNKEVLGLRTEKR